MVRRTALKPLAVFDICCCTTATGHSSSLLKRVRIVSQSPWQVVPASISFEILFLGTLTYTKIYVKKEKGGLPNPGLGNLLFSICCWTPNSCQPQPAWDGRSSSPAASVLHLCSNWQGLVLGLIRPHFSLGNQNITQIKLASSTLTLCIWFCCCCCLVYNSFCKAKLQHSLINWKVLRGLSSSYFCYCLISHLMWLVEVVLNSSTPSILIQILGFEITGRAYWKQGWLFVAGLHAWSFYVQFGRIWDWSQTPE